MEVSQLSAGEAEAEREVSVRGAESGLPEAGTARSTPGLCLGCFKGKLKGIQLHCWRSPSSTQSPGHTHLIAIRTWDLGPPFMLTMAQITFGHKIEQLALV